MKVCRSECLIDMMCYLLECFYILVLLIYFVEWYVFVKLLISEDLMILKKVFQVWGIGILEIIFGVVGGVWFIFYILKEEV